MSILPFSGEVPFYSAQIFGVNFPDEQDADNREAKYKNTQLVYLSLGRFMRKRRHAIKNKDDSCAKSDSKLIDKHVNEYFGFVLDGRMDGHIEQFPDGLGDGIVEGLVASPDEACP